jgi:hypothetical protein
MEKGRENFELVVRSQCRGSTTTSRSSGPVHVISTQTEVLVIYTSRVQDSHIYERVYKRISSMFMWANRRNSISSL